MKPFLTAEWQRLILLTYDVEPFLLEEYLPKGLELDLYKGRAFVSFVAFDFLDTRVKGFKIPFHVDFPEANLRFYVRQQMNDGQVRRGVVFIKEFVPKPCIATVANRFYNEPYSTIQMKSSYEIEEDKLTINHWLKKGRIEHDLKFVVENKPYFPSEDSTEHFFKEHEWGFGQSKAGKLTVYKVEHPVWRIYPLKTRFEMDIHFDKLYGENWAILNGKLPYNIMVAEGSPIKVFPHSVL
ncbi:MAG: YqjF family protein [Saprospiraceae bacterium]